MARVDVIIVDATGNKEQKVGLPDDVRCGVIMVKLVEKIKLPSVGPDGNPISYKFIHKVTGKQLLETQTLAEAGIKSGDVLRLQPEITAGAGEQRESRPVAGVWKKIISVGLVLLFCLSLFACGKSDKTPDSDDAQKTEDTQTVSDADEATEAPSEAEEDAEEEQDPYVDTINLATEKGKIKYLKFEPAASGLLSSDSTAKTSKYAYVFSFAFTNLEAKPSQCQNAFRIQFFQNGVELEDNHSWSSKGGEQYNLVGAYFNDVMKDGTVTFGRIVVGTDDSPVTIMVSESGNDDNYQMQEVSLNGSVDNKDNGTKKDVASVTEAEVDKALQGVWTIKGGTFSFMDGDVSIYASESGQTLNGTYTINLKDSTVDAKLTASNGIVTIHCPFIYENGKLTLKNNQGEDLVKQ